MSMSELAAQDLYGPPVDPLAAGGDTVMGGLLNATGNVAKGLYRDIPRAARWFYDQAGKPEAEAQADTRNVMGGLAEQLYTLPERALGASQEAIGTGTYNPAPAVETALTMMGGGVAGTGAKAGETALTAGYDPKLWHGVSTIKLPKPIDEMSSILRPVNPAAEKVINPAKLQGSLLMPLLGDRTATAAMLDQVNGYKLANPVSLEGGHGYMANNPGMAWAAGKSIAPGIARVAREAAEGGVPVHGVYTAMGERSADFSHMVSDTLAEMAKHTKITPKGEELFNETMRKVSPGFPGIKDPNVAQYLRDAPGAVRNVFAKTMDTSPMQKHGFPSVAEARVAVTDPRLLNEPTGAAGLSIARMDPEGRLGPSGHGTYDTGIHGNYVAGLAASVPKEVMFSDILGPLSKHADAVAQARADAGLKPFRPTEDYLMGRMPKGLPKVQEANQKWVDTVSQNLVDRGFTLGAGATDKKGAAAIQGIRAYHSSPHDFDKFDLSKIGTGEGAQVYGHGLYFAENPAVSGQGGQYWNQFLNKFKGPEREVAERLKASNFDRKAATANVDEELAWLEYNAKHANSPEAAAKHTEMLDALRRLESGAPVGPRTYEVNINADPAHMLDWDKPLREQAIAEKVAAAVPRDLRDIFEKNVASGVTGSNVYHNYLPRQSFAVRAHPGEHFSPSSATSIEDALASVGGDASRVRTILNPSKPAASDVLREAGIPGIKYLDEGSRGAGTGTSNYVIFDPSKIDIMKKYAMPGMIGAGGLGALAAQDQYQP